ncbi:MAG: S8 family serine peptidase [candidate division Zixibacteria bacterium]|nr:S8 family serine peptidase [candidate division Zixibacteria bacterium]
MNPSGIKCTLAICLIGIGLIVMNGQAKTGKTVRETSVQLSPRPLPTKPLTTSISPQSSISHVVVKFHDDLSVRTGSDRLFSKSGAPLATAENLLQPYLGTPRFRRLLSGVAEDRLDQIRSSLQLSSKHALADMNAYFRIAVSDHTEAELLINSLNALDEVELAYFEPVPEPAGDIAPPTSDWVPYQDYREAAPDGVDADYANTLPGGDGAGVRIIDVEGGWQDTHEDLDAALGGLIAGSPVNDPSWRNHGTAVIGVMIAGDNGYGVTGICPGADINMVSVGTIGTAEALWTAADNLEAGDIMLIELHAAGPRYNFQSRPDQLGYICMEYWQANFDAIQYAWAKGVVVIEAGGNGAEDFDDYAMYGSLFDTTYRNSHAIIVGAGYPASSPTNLERQGFSNYGERVNLQGYGSGVYTTGYGDLFDAGGDENQYYTSSFGGTSSASPIITGASACLQGYYEATFGTPMTSDQIRDVLVSTGTEQLGDTSEHIGPRPDLLAAFAVLTGPPSLYVDPLLLDTTLAEGAMATMSIWIHNRSSSIALDFSIVDNDSLEKYVDDNWLTAWPISGTVGVLDSVAIDVSLDASVIEDRIRAYSGALEITWGPSGGTLDSLSLLPVFLEIPCNDTTYASVSSDEPEGPVFQWISARDNGFRVPNSSFYNSTTNPNDDGTTGPWDIGFEFPFYDSFYNEVFIGVNGAISFVDSNVNVNGYFSPFELPGTPITTLIAPLYADLIFDWDWVTGSGLYLYRSPVGDTLVIQWYHPANFNQVGDTTMNFEIILTGRGEIVFQYNNLGTSGLEMSALVGVSDEDCRALSHYNGGDPIEHQISNSDAVWFHNTTYVWIQAGDMDGFPDLNVADLTYLVSFLFTGGPDPIPYAAGNVDCVGDNNIADLTWLVAFLFTGGPAPCYYIQ